MPKKKALVATGNSMLTVIHALLSDPAAVYTDLGADYYERRMHTRRQARNHIKSLERLGYKSPSKPSTPTPANSWPRPAEPRQQLPATRQRRRAAGCCRPPSPDPIFGPERKVPRRMACGHGARPRLA
jgi:hypothetical protein